MDKRLDQNQNFKFTKLNLKINNYFLDILFAN